MKQDVMSCSAVEPKCPCYAAMEVKEAFMGNPQFKETNYYGAEHFDDVAPLDGPCLHCGNEMFNEAHKSWFCDRDSGGCGIVAHFVNPFGAESISICGICSVAGHPHCGQTTGCPCCEIRVKKESQRPTCGDCGELKSSTPQEYNQWTCWPCVDRAGGSYHGTECYCSQCMSYENYAESFSAESNYKKMGSMSVGLAKGNDGLEDMMGQAKRMVEVGKRTGLDQHLGIPYKTKSLWIVDIFEKNAESHGYSYAYNDGHSDARKRDEYRPNLSSTKQESDFKKILKQKAEFASHDFMRGAINPFTQDSMLPVGTLVRSYDFGYPAGDGDKAFVDISCYKEGIIEKIAPSPRCAPDCMHYHIKATKTVWGGKEDKEKHEYDGDFLTHPGSNIRSIAEWDSMSGKEDAEVQFHTRAKIPGIKFDKGGYTKQATPFGAESFSAESVENQLFEEIKKYHPDGTMITWKETQDFGWSNFFQSIIDGVQNMNPHGDDEVWFISSTPYLETLNRGEIRYGAEIVWFDSKGRSQKQFYEDFMEANRGKKYGDMFNDSNPLKYGFGLTYGEKGWGAESFSAEWVMDWEAYDRWPKYKREEIEQCKHEWVIQETASGSVSRDCIKCGVPTYDKKELEAYTDGMFSAEEVIGVNEYGWEIIRYSDDDGSINFEVVRTGDKNLIIGYEEDGFSVEYSREHPFFEYAVMDGYSKHFDTYDGAMKWINSKEWKNYLNSTVIVDSAKGAESYSRNSDGRFTSKSVFSLTTAAIIGLAGAYFWRNKK